MSSSVGGKLLKIGFIGGGKMAQALARGLIRAGLARPSDMTASCHPDDRASAEAFRLLGAHFHYENVPVVEASEVIVVAVKPSIVPVALADVKRAASDARGLYTNKLFISIAMGVSLAQLHATLPQDSRVIRVMPNTPALVRCGASVFVRGPKASDEDVEVTKSMLGSVGTCEEVEEGQLDVVTALSGSGPAYAYLFIEALADGAVKMGMPRDLAYRLASQTVAGAGAMVRDTQTHPGVLKDHVTSPGGSTAAALGVLEANAFRGAVIKAIEEATKKCIEVSKKQ